MYLLRRIGIYTALLAVLVGVIIPVRVNAQAAPPVRPPLSLTTSPLPLNVSTKPGQPVTADIRVKNNGTQQELLKVDLLKFGAAGSTGRPQIQERDPKDQYFNWVTFSETTFTADPNVWKTIHMTISPPKEAAFGYYYAVLFTRANPDKPTNGKSALEGGVASLVLLTVEAPGARREAQITQLTAEHRVYEFLPAKLTVKLHNGGNIHVAPTGTMFIKRGSAQVGAIDFNAERGNILPGTDRVFDLTWSDGFPVFTESQQNGKTVRKLKWDFSQVQKLRFGRYTANLVAVYDDGQRDVPVEAVVSFWVIPWRILGVIFLIILIILIGIWGIGRLIWRSIRRKVVVVAPPASGGTAQAVLQPESEPDPSSLAAAPTRSQRRKQKAEAKAAKKAAEAARKAAQAVPQEVPAVEQAPVEQPVKKRGRPKKAPESAETMPRPPATKAATRKPKVTSAKAPAIGKPKLVTKKPLPTKPRPVLPTKGQAAARKSTKKKGSDQ